MVLKSVGAAAALVAGLLVSGTAFADADHADRVFVGGTVWTGEQGEKPASAIAVKGDHIMAVGSKDDVWPFIDTDTELVDLKGAFVVPGFIDNHVHFILGSFNLTQVDLRGTPTKEEFIRRIAERARTHPGEWMLGGSWDQEYWGGEMPDRRWIDDVTGDTPVLVSRYDEHSLFANSAALKLVGIDADTPDPEGGVILRDAGGRPTGVLKDAAKEMALAKVPAPSDQLMEHTFRAGMQHAVEHGVTQVHDMGWDWRSLHTYERLRDKGQLEIRFYSFVPLADWEQMADYIEKNGRGDDWLRWGGLKGFVDGSLGSTTAWFHKPYLDAPNDTGLTMVDMKTLEERVIGAVSKDLHVAIHAIGDRANDELLDIYKRVAQGKGDRDLRFRIEHAQHLTQDAIKRFGKQHVIASMQPYHAIDDGRWAAKRLEDERLKGTYAFRSIMDSKGRVTFGSDWPVAPLDPIQGIYAAVTRRTIDDKNPDGWYPEQKVSVEQALVAYTRNNAYAGFQDDRLGLIRAGYLADFVVLSQNLFKVDPVTIPDTKVLRTVVGGKDRFVAN
ncbi:MAG: amidohydrolase [Alphaproteobacteria bacterium]|nr:MAG: amidohydrolase [Alphaproteobacteria bacterium]